MPRFQLTWDSVDSAKFKPEELRTEIVTLAWLRGNRNSIYQPTRSTIVFFSTESFESWTMQFKKMQDRIYYSFCEINENFAENKSTIDLTDVFAAIDAETDDNSETPATNYASDADSLEVRRLVRKILIEFRRSL